MSLTKSADKNIGYLLEMRTVAADLMAVAQAEIDGLKRKKDISNEMNQLTGQASKETDILSTIAKIESGGSYTAKNPISSARGKYQFLNSTNKQITQALGKSEA